MDSDPPPSSSSGRKVRFAPKAPPRRTQNPIQPKIEVEVEDGGDDNDEATRVLLRRVKDLGRPRHKVEKKSSVRVTVGQGVATSTSTRTYGKRREESADKSNDSGLKDSAPDNEQNFVSLPSPVVTDGTSENFAQTSSEKKKKKEHREPWDYHHSYYPTALPLRRPYSGDPELLDKAEFGESATNLEYDENTAHSASELGLLEYNEDIQLMFLQFPPNLPLVKRAASAQGKEKADGSTLSGLEGVSAGAKGKEIAGSIISSRNLGASASAKGKERVGVSVSANNVSASKNDACSLEDLPGGYMGKMLVYKSGAIKFKLGETLYDVSPGSDSIFAQDVMAVNTVDEHCCMLGELRNRAVVTPDVDSILDSMI